MPSVQLRFATCAVLFTTVFISSFGGGLNSAHAGENSNPIPLLSFFLSPDNIKQGDAATVYIETTTGFTSPRDLSNVVLGQLDGVDVDLLHPTPTTWIFLGGTLSVGRHKLELDIYVEPTIQVAAIRNGISTLNTQILDLQTQITNEPETTHRAQLQAQVQALIQEISDLQGSILLLRKKVGSDQFSFKVQSAVKLDLLASRITSVQNRLLLIQKNDGGWGFQAATPDEFRDVTTPSFSNQFGIEALSLADAYDITKQPLDLQSMKRTAEALLLFTVNRFHHLFSPDHEFLMKASTLFGFSSYSAKAQASFTAEKEYMASLYVLGQTSPSEADVLAIAQSQIDAVTDAQRISAFRAREIAFGRNPGLRAYDWNQRVRTALLFGDTQYARAIAHNIATDAPLIAVTDAYYLLGLANTILALSPFVADEPTYLPIIQNAHQALLTYQLTNGYFSVSTSQGMAQGEIEDEAYIADALLKVNDFTSLNKLIQNLFSIQAPTGAFIDVGGEITESNAVMLSAFSHIWKANLNLSSTQVSF